MLLLAAVAVLALAAWLLSGHLIPWRRTATAPGDAPQPPVPGLTLQQESDEAARLVRAGRASESLPFYLHLIAELPDNRQVRFNYVIAITNAAVESGDPSLDPAPFVRSSIERVAMLREGLAQLHRVERLVTAPKERAMVRELRGRLFMIWGFPWDALVEFREAQGLDPNWNELASNANLYAWLIHHPDTDLSPTP